MFSVSLLKPPVLSKPMTPDEKYKKEVPQFIEFFKNNELKHDELFLYNKTIKYEGLFNEKGQMIYPGRFSALREEKYFVIYTLQKNDVATCTMHFQGPVNPKNFTIQIRITNPKPHHPIVNAWYPFEIPRTHHGLSKEINPYKSNTPGGSRYYKGPHEEQNKPHEIEIYSFQDRVSTPRMTEQYKGGSENGSLENRQLFLLDKTIKYQGRFNEKGQMIYPGWFSALHEGKYFVIYTLQENDVATCTMHCRGSHIEANNSTIKIRIKNSRSSSPVMNIWHPFEIPQIFYHGPTEEINPYRK
jgi:hypothetical protein